MKSRVTYFDLKAFVEGYIKAIENSPIYHFRQKFLRKPLVCCALSHNIWKIDGFSPWYIGKEQASKKDQERFEQEFKNLKEYKMESSKDSLDLMAFVEGYVKAIENSPIYYPRQKFLRKPLVCCALSHNIWKIDGFSPWYIGKEQASKKDQKRFEQEFKNLKKYKAEAKAYPYTSSARIWIIYAKVEGKTLRKTKKNVRKMLKAA